MVIFTKRLMTKNDNLMTKNDRLVGNSKSEAGCHLKLNFTLVEIFN